MFQNFLSRFQRSSREPSPELLRERIGVFEEQARTAPAERRGSLFNRAGDLCLKEGFYERSLKNFGQAINSYLESGHLDAAPSLCQKVIRVAPEVVRARSTLAAISLAEGLFGDARHQIVDYVRAAESAAQEELAAKRLRLMAAATENEQIRLLIGEYLLDLGDAASADQVFGAVFAERNGLRPLLSDDPEERWGRLLPVALMGPTDMIRHEALWADRPNTL